MPIKASPDKSTEGWFDSDKHKANRVRHPWLRLKTGGLIPVEARLKYMSIMFSAEFKSLWWYFSTHIPAVTALPYSVQGFSETVVAYLLKLVTLPFFPRCGKPQGLVTPLLLKVDSDGDWKKFMVHILPW